MNTTQMRTQEKTSESTYVRGSQIERGLAFVAGMRVRNLREFMRISRESLSKLIGVPKTTIKNYELNYRKTDLTVVVQFSKIFGDESLNVLAYLSTLTDGLDLKKTAEDYFIKHPEHLNLRIDHSYTQQLCTCGHGRCM